MSESFSKMSELSINDSYEELVKKIKPCSVVFERISPEKVSTLKVIDDPSRINDETPAFNGDISDVEIVEEEVEVDLAEAEANALNENNESRVISCFFCKKKDFNGYTECENHFKLHIDYFPIQCSLCDEANIDVLAFVKHCRKSHPEQTKATYIHKLNSNCFNWITRFLAEGPAPEFKDKPHKFCPACDWIGLNSDPNSTEPTKAVKPLQILRHIHEHIRYKPFSCIKCREKGQDFRIHALDYNDPSMRVHIQTEHKDISPPFWRHFSKKYSIPSLDKFIGNYLNIFGVKMPKHRMKKKIPKLDPSLCSGQPISSVPAVQSVVVSTPVTKTLVNNQMGINGSAQFIRLMSPTTSQAQSFTTPITLTLKNGIQFNNQNLFNNLTIQNTSTPVSSVVFAPGTTTSYLQMQTPLLMQPSNDKLNKQHFIVDAADLNIVHIDPAVYEIEDREFKYICVFCDENKEFGSDIDMCVHYGIHFNYHPVVCMLCDKRFQDLSTLCEHYNRDHNEFKNQIFHYLKQDEKLEKWIRDFVDFQKTHFFKGHVSARFGDYCFVCEKLAKTDDTTMRLKINKVNINAIRDHINQHLNYFPYLCAICHHGNREVKFTSFNPSAIQHMWKFHVDGSAIPHSTLARLLLKCNENLELEKFIDNKLFPKRDRNVDNPLVLNLKRKLQEIEAESKKRLESCRLSSSQMPSLPSAQVHPMVRNDNKEQKTSEIRHLTPKMKTYSSPSKINGSSFRSPVSLPKTIDYIPTKQTYIEPYLLCFHCHEKVANTTELQIHHQSKHPKLTIASYAPTKRDLIV